MGYKMLCIVIVVYLATNYDADIDIDIRLEGYLHSFHQSANAYLKDSLTPEQEKITESNAYNAITHLRDVCMYMNHKEADAFKPQFKEFVLVSLDRTIDKLNKRLKEVEEKEKSLSEKDS